MSESPGRIVRRGPDAPGGAMVISEAAVMRRVNAYNKFADGFDSLIEQIMRKDSVSIYGNLKSLRQVAQNYHDLMVTGDESLVGRLIQFRDQARQIADKLQRDWQTIKDEDTATSSALKGIEQG